jgi:hypothetical protein
VIATRFGGGRRGCFFAVRNPGPARDLTLTLDRRSLALGHVDFTAITGCQLRRAGANSVRLAVPARWTAVIAVNRPEARALAVAHERELQRFRQQAHEG